MTGREWDRKVRRKVRNWTSVRCAGAARGAVRCRNYTCSPARLCYLHTDQPIYDPRVGGLATWGEDLTARGARYL